MRTITLNSPISQLEIGSQKETMRVTEVLKQAGIETIEDLCHKTKSELKRIPQLGDLSISRIELGLNKEFLGLGMSDTELERISKLKGKIQEQRENVLETKHSIPLKLLDQLIELEHILGLNQKDESPDNEFDHHSEDENEYIVDEDDAAENGSEERDKDLTVVVHNNIHLPIKAEVQPIDWDERFYEVAKEEFINQSRTFITIEGRASHAIHAADVFIEMIKDFYEKGKTNNTK